MTTDVSELRHDINTIERLCDGAIPFTSTEVGSLRQIDAEKKLFEEAYRQGLISLKSPLGTSVLNTIPRIEKIRESSAARRARDQKTITVTITLSEAMTAVYALRQHATVEADEKTSNECEAIASRVREAFVTNLGDVDFG